MFYFLAVLCGAVLAVMIQWNGDLSAQVGAYHAALYIHIVGAVFALMLENPTSGGWGSVLISLGAGITVVLSRIVNAHLSQRIGALQGSLVNHLVGLPFCLLLALSVGANESFTATPFMAGDFRLWIWCGGMLGVTTVAMTNVIVPKIPAYQLSLFLFCGQLFCGMLLDVFGGGALNEREFGAGVLVAAGIGVSQVVRIRRGVC